MKYIKYKEFMIFLLLSLLESHVIYLYFYNMVVDKVSNFSYIYVLREPYIVSDSVLFMMYYLFISIVVLIYFFNKYIINIFYEVFILSLISILTIVLKSFFSKIDCYFIFPINVFFLQKMLLYVNLFIFGFYLCKKYKNTNLYVFIAKFIGIVFLNNIVYYINLKITPFHDYSYFIIYISTTKYIFLYLSITVLFYRHRQ